MFTDLKVVRDNRIGVRPFPTPPAPSPSPPLPCLSRLVTLIYRFPVMLEALWRERGEVSAIKTVPLGRKLLAELVLTGEAWAAGVDGQIYYQRQTRPLAFLLEAGGGEVELTPSLASSLLFLVGAEVRSLRLVTLGARRVLTLREIAPLAVFDPRFPRLAPRFFWGYPGRS